MAVTFRAPSLAIERAVERLKEKGLVHPDAVFRGDAPDGLRREIAYRDTDLAYFLGRTDAEKLIADEALDFLIERGVAPSKSSYDSEACERHRSDIKREFRGTWTTLTPAMERLIYMLTSVRRPRHLIEFGSFWGYTLAWFAGPCIGRHSVYRAERIIGIDIDAAMTERARENFSRLPNADEIELFGEDARTVLERLDGPFDFVYIEAKSDAMEGMYLELLERVYDRLPEGAWVIAHDNIDWTFRGEMERYLPYVRDGRRFRESVSFEIDDCGLELSIK